MARSATLQLTARDVAICQALTRFYGLTVEQVTRRCFGSVQTAYHRLNALVRAGYVVAQRPWYRGPGVYMVTHAGARLADVGLTAPQYKPMALGHHLAVADLADLLLAGHPGSRWMCERELRRDSMTTVRDRRRGQLLDGVPHVPDGLLTLPTGQGVAVEVELTKKGDAEYHRIFRWYARTMTYERVVWFVATGPLHRRLDELIRREQYDDFAQVQPLPEGVTVRAWT